MTHGLVQAGSPDGAGLLDDMPDTNQITVRRTGIQKYVDSSRNLPEGLYDSLK